MCFQAADPIVQGDRIAVYWVGRGTHSDTVLNIPPTGRRVAINGVSLMRVKQDHIPRRIFVWDMAGMLRDLGLLSELDYRTPAVTTTFQEAVAMFGG